MTFFGPRAIDFFATGYNLALMTGEASKNTASAVDSIYRAESRRVLATLIRLLGDFDLAEEALR